MQQSNNHNTNTRTHGTSSTTQACAACKYQRRKCADDCILAPYFPHHRQRQFLNAHRLFGVSNIIKIVRHLDPPAKDHAMRTIIFQSDARAADPVGGCYRIIRDLEHQISLAKAELEIVLHHLALCRGARQQAPANGGYSAIDGDDPLEFYKDIIDDVNSLSCMHGNGDVDVDVDVHGNGNSHAESTSSSFPYHHHQMSSLSLEECCEDDMKNIKGDVKNILDHLSCGDHDGEITHDHEEFKFDSHGNIVPSNNSILTQENGATLIKEEDEMFSYIQDRNDLKAAATFFTLTNCDI